MKLVAVVAAVMLAGCTPAERAWFAWQARPLANDEPVPCAQWIGTSRVAGFTDEEIPTEHAVMWAESRCNPDAWNPSGASGLLQIMPMWADDCGTTPAGLFNPQLNVTCALHVLAVQGWHAWSTYPP